MNLSDLTKKQRKAFKRFKDMVVAEFRWEEEMKNIRDKNFSKGLKKGMKAITIALNKLEIDAKVISIITELPDTKK